jgi:hypothetical protein
MKRIVAALLFVACSSLAAYTQSVSSGDFWIPTSLKWRHPQGAPEGERTAPAIIFFFAKNGQVVRDDCWLIKGPDSIAISNGDPHNEYIGQTEPIADGVHVTYRLVRRTVEREGETLPGHTISEDMSTLPKSGLSDGKLFFQRVQFSNANEYEARYIALLKGRY